MDQRPCHTPRCSSAISNSPCDLDLLPVEDVLCDDELELDACWFCWTWGRRLAGLFRPRSEDDGEGDPDMMVSA
jgi:hypothetical protein